MKSRNPERTPSVPPHVVVVAVVDEDDPLGTVADVAEEAIEEAHRADKQHEACCHIYNVAL